MEKEKVYRHKIIQDILDNYLSLMSGKIIKGPGREQQRYSRVDYLCETEGELAQPPFHKEMVLPFDHLKPNSCHIIEFKSLWQVLNESTFREYVGRALVFENSDPKEKYLGRLTLTILTTRKPESLISNGLYAIDKINEWKYISRCFPILDITILVVKGMRNQKQGEALALLQVLDPEGWTSVFSQELENTTDLKEIATKISQEVYMNLAQELKKEGKQEVAIKMLKKDMEVILISELTGLPEEEITALKQELTKIKNKTM